jgi:F-type H+-transporting ATPase subunit epsilon
MQVEILTPDTTLFSGDATVVTLPGTNGSFQIMTNHAPIIANLKAGMLEIKGTDNTETFEIKGGLVEVIGNKVIVLV